MGCYDSKSAAGRILIVFLFGIFMDVFLGIGGGAGVGWDAME